MKLMFNETGGQPQLLSRACCRCVFENSKWCELNLSNPLYRWCESEFTETSLDIFNL